jgi:hypothetical protein
MGGTFAAPPPSEVPAAPAAPVAPEVIDGQRTPWDQPNVRMPVRVAPDRATVRKALEKRRAKNLAAFRAYHKGGVYPHNRVRVGPLNVWIDEAGNLCAAATMISKDGKDELVKKTGAENNNIRLLNVTEGPLLDWMMTSGFTLEEIDRIQLPGDFVGIDFQIPKEELQREDARLAKAYRATDAWLVKHKKSGLDLATDRLMKNTDLAWRLIDGTI